MKRFNLKRMIKKNGKFIRLFSLTLCGLLLCTACSFLIAGIIKRVQMNSSTVPPTEETETLENKITYRAVENDVVVYVYDGFFKENGQYPELYKDGETLHVDDLNDTVFITAYENRMFHGWYLDSVCSVPFVNDTEYNGNLVLYAKLSVGYWRPKTYAITYKVIAQGYVVDIPENAFVKGRNYPTSYTEGETVVIDDPVSSYFYDSYNQYEFRGWYLDEACTIPFDGEKVGKSEADVTIYAKTKWYLWSPNV